MVIFADLAAGLLAVHLFFAALALAGTALGAYFILCRRNWRFGNMVAALGSVGFVLAWTLGLVIYPVFRVAVRAANFDANVPWATGLFEIKEHVASVGLAAALVLLALAARGTLSPELKRTYVLLLVLLAAITALEAAIGGVLTGVQSI